MKTFLIGTLCIFLIGNTKVTAQETSMTTGKVNYNGVEYPAYIKVVDVSPEQAITAIKEVFTSRGKEAKTIKGFLVYRNVVLPGTGNYAVHDLFVKVDREGKKADNKSKIYMIITDPGKITDDKVSKGEKAAVAGGVALVAGGQKVFDDVTPALENQAYLKAVLDQEAVVRKADQKLKDLQDDKLKMEKQLAKLQEDMEKNRLDIEAQIKEVENANATLEAKKLAKPVKKN
jgi:hypothetical protein